VEGFELALYGIPFLLEPATRGLVDRLELAA